MPGWIVPCGGLAVLVAVIGLFIAAMYNRFVTLRNRVDNAWAQIDVQLKQRYDLIPNLVETVKGYASHEKDTLERVIQARNMAVNATGPEAQGQAENMLTGALKSLFAVAEAYPDLKANVNFMDLQQKLADLEQKIAYARQFYNDQTMTFNNAVQTFPSSVVAGMFRFAKRDYFETEEAATGPVSVQF